jgi:putative NIF3 family GTP cyclohydrolase 1 type 2
MNRKPGEMSEERTRRRRRRSVSVAEISDFLEYLAPPWLSVPEEPWGLQAGSSSAEVKTVVVSPMPTQSALSTAASRKQSLLLTCAPPADHADHGGSAR